MAPCTVCFFKARTLVADDIGRAGRFQAALGMWTVTLLLKPAIVTLHLLGGMLTLSLLAWLALREMTWRPLPHAVAASRWGPWAALALAVAFCQIAVAHNAGAAFMLIALLMLNFGLSHRQVSLA